MYFAAVLVSNRVQMGPDIQSLMFMCAQSCLLTDPDNYSYYMFFFPSIWGCANLREAFNSDNWIMYSVMAVKGCETAAVIPQGNRGGGTKPHFE